MGPRSSEIDDQPTADNTPEDVAALYSWANLQGAKYRDYSASRREYRAQARYRAAREMLERELKAQVEAEAAAALAERIAAQSVSQAPGAIDAGTFSSAAGDAASRAAAERVEVARRAESAARAAVLALREEREIAEAHSSAKRQAQVYEESELRRRQLAGPQPQWPLEPGDSERVDLRNNLIGNPPQHLAADSAPGDEELRIETELEREFLVSSRADAEFGTDSQNAPAWLFSAQAAIQPQPAPPISQAFRADVATGDTLQDSRERVASRWFALKDVFAHAGPELPAMHPLRARAEQRPLVAVFSLSGGVGKTSLLATLARALSVEGEKVAVVDTTSQGLLSIYFGSNRAGRSGSIEDHTSDPGGQESVALFLCNSAGGRHDEHEEELQIAEILRNGQGNHRLLIDIATGSSWLIRRLVDLHPIALVPMAPDMNSVISVQSIERLFRGVVDADGRSLLPFYVLNQFDATLPLHLDVREVLRRQLGDRLLPHVIPRSPLVGEALAEGMTVLDYAPDAPVTQEYQTIAKWLRSVSPPATQETRGVLRGER